MAVAWAAAGRSPVKSGHRKPTSIITAFITSAAILLLIVAQRSWLPPGLLAAGAGSGVIAVKLQQETRGAAAEQGAAGQSLRAPPLPRPLAPLAAAGSAREWREGEAFQAPISRCTIAPDGELDCRWPFTAMCLASSAGQSAKLLPPGCIPAAQEAAAGCVRKAT